MKHPHRDLRRLVKHRARTTPLRKGLLESSVRLHSHRHTVLGSIQLRDHEETALTRNPRVATTYPCRRVGGMFYTKNCTRREKLASCYGNDDGRQTTSAIGIMHTPRFNAPTSRARRVKVSMCYVHPHLLYRGGRVGGGGGLPRPLQHLYKLRFIC